MMRAPCIGELTASSIAGHPYTAAMWAIMRMK